MSGARWVWILGGLGLLALMAAGGVAVTYSWEESAEGKKWAPALTAAEQKYGIPAGLLSRQAAEESSFDPSVIYGEEASSAGALGILQLEPAYFSSVNVPVPFTDADVLAQIDQAAQYDAELRRRFGSWQLALEAYNWGPTALARWEASGGDPSELPTQSSNYSAQILADVPTALNA
ncbi:MAG: transglycosylase SLT domain-containing protein [Planctomycetota bacterium]